MTPRKYSLCLMEDVSKLFFKLFSKLYSNTFSAFFSLEIKDLSIFRPAYTITPLQPIQIVTKRVMGTYISSFHFTLLGELP